MVPLYIIIKYCIIVFFEILGNLQKIVDFRRVRYNTKNNLVHFDGTNEDT